MAAQAERHHAPLTVRLFVDLDCPHTRRAWPQFAALQQNGVTLVLHHVPLSAHPLAQVAAQAAVAARLQGRELGFVQALFSESKPDDTAILRAAEAAGMDRGRLASDLNSPQVKRIVERERQAALAFGVRATPSALINGQGLSGEPPELQLRRLVSLAQWQADNDEQAFGPGTDGERLGIVRHHPEVLGAFDALRLEQATTHVRGVLGPLFKVAPLPGDLSSGDASAELTLTIFVDPSQAWTTLEATQLSKIAGARPTMRVVVRVLANRGGETLSAGVAALSELPERGAVLQVLLNGSQPWTPESVRQAVRSTGAEARWERLLREPRLAVWLHTQAEQARHIKAQPGSVFLNGRVWLGRVGDAGLSEAMLEASRAFHIALQSHVSAEQAYAHVIERGQWFGDEELDLSEPEDIESLWQLPAMGGNGNRVVLLLEPGSLASRAAWTMLKRRPSDAKAPIVLHVGALQGKKDPRGEAMRALLAGASLKRLPEVVDGLLDAKAGTGLGPAWLAKQLRIAPEQASAAWQSASPELALAAMAGVRKQIDCGDEPVVFVASRLYRGPLEEARLVQATAAQLSEPMSRAQRNAQ